MKKLFAILAVVATAAGVFAQTGDPVVIEVGNEKIHRSELMREYANSTVRRPNVKQEVGESALREYANLYSIFKAKLLDAHKLGYDTLPALRNEMAKYRAELAAPYLIDSAVQQSLLREAYERNRYSLHAAHMLVHCSPDASPADTMKAYARILALRQRVMEGEDFFAVAQDEAKANNPEAKVNPNEGDLGYFTVFNMVYPFESAAYALEVGEVSQPVRTRFGYHIIKLLDKVEMTGKCDMAHIWLSAHDSTQKRDRIEEIYKRMVRDGSPFETEARHSDDQTTRNNGGMLPNATLSNLPPEYIHVLQHMNPGDISEPFFTKYGWHIIKLVRKETLGTFEEMVPYYKQRMSRDQRGDQSRKAFAASTRKKYGIKDYTVEPVMAKNGKVQKVKGKVMMQASLDEMRQLATDSLFFAKWKFDEGKVKNLGPLVEVPGRTYNAVDYGRYLQSHQKKQSKTDLTEYVDKHYADFLDSVSVSYADSQLEKEYPEFAELLEDYYDGLLIFDYNDKQIWSKAIHDSVGFADFYARSSKTKRMDNPADSMFFWRHRARLVVVDVTDSAAVKPAKVQKLLTKALQKGVSSMQMKEQVAKACRKGMDNAVRMHVESVERKGATILADDQWQKGVYMVPMSSGYRAIVVEDVLPPMLKGQMEARGYYLSEYQNEVERLLGQRLKSQYNIKINL